ncbi:MAG: DNA-binding response regulator [Flavobacteriaceae bacterium]|nr:MAG: DNA-binding response regulator [Flavobacteriaceae bacterium]
MEVVIIEDEDLAAVSLENLLLKSNFDIRIKARLESVEDSLIWFKTNTCDLIFSDIHLGDGESLEIFETLNIKIPIIFTTAFGQYAIQSFQFFAIDYLLKPYNKEKLHLAIQKYVDTRSLVQQSNENTLSVVPLPEVPKEKIVLKERFLVHRGKQLISVNSKEVACFMAQDKYLFLYTSSGDSYLYEDTISNLTDKLSKKHFFKINRKFIVRHDAIKNIVMYSKNRIKIELYEAALNDSLILVSSKNNSEFKKWLNN